MQILVNLIALSVLALSIIYAFASQSMIWPVKGKITSPFGYRHHPVTGNYGFHNGVDIEGGIGKPIVSPFNGKVESVYNTQAGGKQLKIKHSNGYTSIYAHLSAIYVSEGDQVKRGDKIAAVGDTGRVTGPHLHLSIKNSDDQYINPETVLR